PAHDLARVDVDDRVAVVLDALGRAAHGGYVPGPHLVRPVGFQARDPVGAGALVAAAAAFTHQAAFGEHPVHLAFRAQVGALVEQRRIHLGRGQITEPLAAERFDDHILLGAGERRWVRPRWQPGGTRGPNRPALGALATVAIGPLVHTEGRTGPLHPDLGSELGDVRVEHLHDAGSALLRRIACKSADAFPCASINSSAVASLSSKSVTLARNRASSALVASALGPGRLARIASNAPLSRWSRHAEINDEYRPSRRMISPRSALESAASSSARTFSLYFAGYDWRAGRTSGSGFFEATASTVVTDIPHTHSSPC